MFDKYIGKIIEIIVQILSEPGKNTLQWDLKNNNVISILKLL